MGISAEAIVQGTEELKRIFAIAGPQGYKHTEVKLENGVWMLVVREQWMRGCEWPGVDILSGEGFVGLGSADMSLSSQTAWLCRLEQCASG